MRKSAGACMCVTQRMLTRTLRQLERDGLVMRHDFEEVPPRVEYQLSDSGLELLVRMVPPMDVDRRERGQLSDGKGDI